jgi:hypothetical protein
MIHSFTSNYLIGEVLTHIPVEGNLTKDVPINIDITFQDFVSRMCAIMGIDPTTAKLGWKSSDDTQRAPARQLVNEDDLKNAVCDILKMQSSTRRTKQVVMRISDAVSFSPDSSNDSS